MVLPIHNLQWDLHFSELIRCGIHPKFNRICNLICKYLVINLDNRLVIPKSNNLSNLFNLLFRYLHQVQFSSLVRVHLELQRKLLHQLLFKLPHLFLEYLQLLFLQLLKYQYQSLKFLLHSLDLQSRLLFKCLQVNLVQVQL